MLFELVRTAAAQRPELAAIISAQGELSYRAFAERSERVARALNQRGVERFGCLLQSPVQALVVLAASSAVGSEACLYPPDPGPGGLRRMASRLGHTVVVVDSPVEAPGLNTLTVDELERSSRSSRISGMESDFPVMILTTGTTGESKGARHDWRLLLKAVRHRDEEPGSRWLSSYNLNQFAGIQVLLHVLANQATLVEARSRRADDIIAAIREHGVTHASATPTFWRLLVGRLDRAAAAQLPLQQITLGGEAAPEAVIRRLRVLFPTARISHVYAGTEFGSVVSVRDGHSGLPLSVLDRPDTADVQVRIVDGELQVRSRVGMLGYHDAGDDAGQWRPTGDLVEVRHGRIHFVGRTSEIINVGGAKVHPLPVEELLCSVDGVQLAAVYGRANPVTGQIVAADVVVIPGTEVADLEQRLREAWQTLPPAARPRRLRFVPELSLRENKLMREEACPAVESG